MPTIVVSGAEVKLDNAGYLMDFEEWNEDVARALALREGVRELSKDRIDILLFMRSYYREHKFFPIIRAVCKNVHQPKECVTEHFMDPVRAWKIAGLPNPGEEVDLLKTWEPLGF